MNDKHVDDLLKDLDHALAVEPSPSVAASARMRFDEPRPRQGRIVWIPAGIVLALAGVAAWPMVLPTQPERGVRAVAQTTPDFSGTWIDVGLEDAEKNLRRQEQLYAAGLINQQTLESVRLSVQDRRRAATQVITQTGATITVRNDALVATYDLNGAETRNTTGSANTTAKLTWVGNRLVILEWTTHPDGSRTPARRVWALDGQGQLVVQVTALSPVGVELNTVLTTYRKQ